jgi:hypothetical protein
MSDRLVWPNLDGAWSRENAQRSMQRHQLAGAHDAGTGMRRLAGATGDGRWVRVAGSSRVCVMA